MLLFIALQAINLFLYDYSGMFSSSKLVIHLTQTTISFTLITSKNPPQVKKKIEIPWKESYLPQIIEKLPDNFKKQKVKVILDDDLSYLLKINLPPSINDQEIKDYILKKVKDLVPEKLKDAVWDFKLKQTPTGKEALVYSIIPEYTRPLLSSLSKHNIQVETIEPASVSSINSSPSLSKNRKPPVLPILIFLILISTSFFIYQKVSSKTPTTPVDLTNLPTTTPAPSATPTPSPEPQVDQYSLNIEIQNGVGTPGLAGKLITTLKELGYQSLEASNADSYNYDTSVLKVKKDYQSIADDLLLDFQESYPQTTLSKDSLKSTSDFDLVFIIGEN